MCVGSDADGVAAGVASGAGSSVCFLSDSVMERRNSSMSTFCRANCFGAGAEAGAEADGNAGAGVKIGAGVESA